MGQLLLTNSQQMFAITGDHVYFNRCPLQIFAVYFDPIWKPDAVVVEPKVAGSLNDDYVFSVKRRCLRRTRSSVESSILIWGSQVAINNPNVLSPFFISYGF
jgi:hypothetical protein